MRTQMLYISQIVSQGLFRLLMSFSLLPLGLLMVAGCSDVSSTDMALSTSYLATGTNETALLSDSSSTTTAGKFVAWRASGAATQRKIIYNAKIAIETSDIEQFGEQLTSKMGELDGFVAEYNEQRFAGDRRAGSWTIRIDSLRFNEMLSWLDAKTHVTRKEVTSEDVSEEFVDLTARLENKRNTEGRLAKVLDERSGKLEEVLAVEREIDRVREDLERIEGRLRYLNDRVMLSTVTLTVSTRVEYAAPKAVAFLARVVESWNRSVSALRKTGETFAVGMVSFIPWSPVVFAFLAAVYWLSRLVWCRLQHLAGLNPTSKLASSELL